MTNSEILAKIGKLRQDYLAAAPEDQEAIKQEAAKLDKQLQRCYQCGKVLADDHESWLCSQECKDKFNPDVRRKSGKAMSWDELRKEMQRLAYEAKLKKYGYQPKLED